MATSFFSNLALSRAVDLAAVPLPRAGEVLGARRAEGRGA